MEAADVSGKNVLVRADLNVPLANGVIADDTRIRAAMPTLQLLLERGAARVTLCSHLGRPKTEADRLALSMAPVAERVRELVPDERIHVLENTRFHAGETKNDEGYARELADANEVYVNDAFGSAHRAHSSTEAVAHVLPAYAGLLLLAELEHLGRLLGEVERPFVLIAGGAKVDDKLAVLENLGGRADTVLIGGKMAEQVREHNPLSFACELPTDVVAASAFAEDADARDVPIDGIPDGWLGLDIGPRTAEAYGAIVREARTIFWNGPMGVFEWERFAARHARRRRGRGERRCIFRGRWRRFGQGDPRARSRRQRLVGLDRGRGFTRAARGQGASRHRGDPVCGRGGTTMMKLIAGNWKMFKGPTETLAFFDAFEAPDGVDVVLCPPFVSLEAAVGEEWPIYAQNVHWAESGAFTGEISPSMLVELGVQGALVGHSERRTFFGETDETVRLRAEAALAAGLRVIACVGETEDERERGET